MTEKYGGNGKGRRSVFAGQRSVIRGRVAHGKYVPHDRGAVTPDTWEERLSDVSHTRNLTILVGHKCRVWQTMKLWRVSFDEQSTSYLACGGVRTNG